MSRNANLLSEGDIEATNVLPAFETSLKFGATEAELASEVGWVRADLERPSAYVSGESTYRHMELMYGKPNYAEFVLAVVCAHDVSSLGIVGLACKTVANVGAAIACHARFQHLTNRTARYESRIEQGQWHLREQRAGKPRLGSFLVSELSMFIAVRLLELVAAVPPTVLAMRSRRREIPKAEQARYVAFLGTEVELGSACAELVFDAAITHAPIANADAELEAYFRRLLEDVAPPPREQPEVVSRVRRTLREHLPHGTPTVHAVARANGLGSRTLQRRLAEVGVSFASVLDDVRRELAEGYLRRSDRSLAEVAYLLGYVEQPSFFRAFRRWHGTSPDAYRRALKKG